MKWLRIIPTMNPAMGGPSQGIRNSIPELEKHGVYNEVVCFDHKAAEYLKNDQFPIHALGPSSGPWAYCKKLKPWLLENFSRFDVVIVHGLWLYHSYATINAFLQYKRNKSRKVPSFFVMPHGMLDPYFQKAKGRKIKAIRNWLYWQWTEKKLIHEADGILFTSEEELLLARNAFRPYRPQKELNISYGIKKPPVYTSQMKQAFLQACKCEEMPPYLIFLGRIHPKKGVDLLVKAYIQLKEQNEDLPSLVIAGPGLETEYGTALKALAQSVKSIIFPGMITGDAKWGAFYGAEAFILPSHQENFGISVVEALACGQPVLITDKINIWREIYELDAGIVAPDTFQGVSDMLKEWFSTPIEQKTEMRDNALSAFSKCFSIEDAVKRMAAMISIAGVKE
ncbi:MAG: glycosyltransferase [Chitinophagaceae bacterium]